MALVDFFLKLDGIPGESRDAHHKDEIDLESFSWGESHDPGGGGGGAAVAAGKAQFEDLNVVMKLSKASPLLLLACASGQHIKGAVLTARRAVKTQLEFLVIKLTDVTRHLLPDERRGLERADRPRRVQLREDRARLPRAEPRRLARPADRGRLGRQGRQEDLPI